MRLRYNTEDPFMDDPSPTLTSASERQLSANVRALMKLYRWTQTDLAEKLGETQSWVSRRMSASPDKKYRWKVEDLDALALAFEVPAYTLLRPGHGRVDRRSSHARRVIPDRRAAFTQEAVVAPSALSPVAATTQAIEASNRLYEAAEQLHAAADALLRRHAAIIGALPPDRLTVTGDLGNPTGGAGEKKTG